MEKKRKRGFFMKKITVCILFWALILSLTLTAGAVSVNQVFAYSDPNWGKGNATTADGLWKYEWFARETNTFAAMSWNSGEYYEAQFQTAAASDTHWYCRVRTNGTNLHPGAQADATMTFLCPESGNVTLSVTLQRQSAPSPSGNTVRVMRNNTVIPVEGQTDYKLENTNAFNLSVTTDVAKGDSLRLLIGSQGNSSADGVNFSGLKVKYNSGANLEPEKPTYKITCVGDSVTEGYGTTGGFKGVNAWPYVLETHLKNAGVANFAVTNCGKSATTALTTGDRPYKNAAEYITSKASDPDIVFICLGTNDSKAANWNATKYKADYKALIQEYMNLPSKPTVYMIYTTYVADQSKTGCRRTVIQNEIMPIQDQIAKELGLKVIDLNTLTKQNATKYSDGVHPNDELQAMMGEYVYNALCSEGVVGLSAKNATATVSMIDPSKPATPVTTTTTTTTTKVSGGVGSGSSIVPDPDETTDVSDGTESAFDTATDSTTPSSDSVTDTSHLTSFTTVPYGPTETTPVTDSFEDAVGTASDLPQAPSSGGWVLWAVLGGIALLGAFGAAWYFFLYKKN